MNMIKYKTPNGLIDIPAGVAFSKDGVQYPSNWLESLSDAELAGMGLVKYTVPDAVIPTPPTLTKTYKADIFRRATDGEIDIIDAALAARPKKERRLFEHALYIDHADPMFTVLMAGFSQAFGVQRAAQLLAPSEG